MSEVTLERRQTALPPNGFFTPATPVEGAARFIGRGDQIRDLVEAVGQRGQHVVIYGERGVGKTSLAGVLSELQGQQILAQRVACDSTDDYASVWRKALEHSERVRAHIGLDAARSLRDAPEAKGLPDSITPGDICRLLAGARVEPALVIIFDEFDRLNPEARALFADTIKTLSDDVAPVTLILVGVAATASDLIANHESIERAVFQVFVPRMSAAEIHQLVEQGLAQAAMTISPGALQRITALSQGLPYYAHLLGLLSARVAADAAESCVQEAHVDGAVERAVERAPQTLLSAFKQATLTAQAESLYGPVLLACALTGGDERRYFEAGDVGVSLARITGETRQITAFARHLHGFCEPGRASVLESVNDGPRVRFRFRNPMMQPFVIMHGLRSHLLAPSVLAEI